MLAGHAGAPFLRIIRSSGSASQLATAGTMGEAAREASPRNEGGRLRAMASLGALIALYLT